MSGVPDTFNGYHVWLGIPPAEQPPNHYRLLGITVFEADLDVIDHAADRQMAHVRTFQSGKHGALSQQILNELSAARLCLLTTEKKASYDRELRAKLDSAKPMTAMPVGQAVPRARPVTPAKIVSPPMAAPRPAPATSSAATAKTMAATVAPSAEVALDFEPIMPDLPSTGSSTSYTMRPRRLGRRIDWRRYISWGIFAAIGMLSLAAIFYVVGLVRTLNWQELWEGLDPLESPPSASRELTSGSPVPAVEAPRPETPQSPGGESTP